MSTEQFATVERRILRHYEVEAKTGFKRAHINTLMKENRFPRAIRLGIRAVGWDSVEIDQWIIDRIKERSSRGRNMPCR
jgi:prophage regulatory protein